MQKIGLVLAISGLTVVAGCSSFGEHLTQKPIEWPTASSALRNKANESTSNTTIQTVGFEKSEGTGVSSAPVPRSPVESAIGELGPFASQWTLTDIETMAMANNPTLQAAIATSNKAAGIRQQVGTRPNPTAGYFGQQLADRQTDQHGLFIEQEFVRGNKLALNREVLGHTHRAQDAEGEAQRLRVLTDVRIRFYEAVAAQQQLAAIRSFQEVARQGVQLAEARQRAEEGSLIETLQARTLVSEVSLAAEQAEVAYRGAWHELAAIAGIPAATSAKLVADLALPAERFDWESTIDEILAQSPEIMAAEAIVCEKQALIQRERVQMIPNVTAQLGAGYDVATNHGLINVQLSAPLPVANRNSGNIAAANSDYIRATQDVERLRQSVRSRMARVQQEYESAFASVLKYDDEIIPQTKESLELSEMAYRSGELDFLQVLVVRRSFYEATVRAIQARGELSQAVAKVNGLLLTGGLDSPTDFTNGDNLRNASFGGQ
jgi:outer membrane protein, heavy metal efflux system